jgi:ParB family transcriptional regulator, chromosome partitioning protein
MRLLELPDEALELLERGTLTEGHGRALMLATENADRRRLARQAAGEAWSVRELERQARAAGTDSAIARGSAGAPGARRRGEDHPDRAAAIEQIADILGEALGADVQVRATARGFTAELALASVDEALDLARRLHVHRAA